MSRFRIFASATAFYLAASVGLWWGVWTTHPSTVTTCGCGDAARFLWFFEWPAFALTNGHSLLYSQWLFHPTGINLLNDTSVLALSVVLTPVTLLFGPIAAMNVALSLAPMLSALAMFVLLRRWVTWMPAAVLGGLLYGFSPFLITELAYNQLNIAFLPVLPLLVLGMDELLVRQRRSPYVGGAAVAGLVVVQFFVSTEVLLITVIAAAVAGVVALGWAAAHKPAGWRSKAGHALRGSATALGASVAVLAYPAWFLLQGPAHLAGPIWANGAIDQFGNSLSSFWNNDVARSLATQMHGFGGYQGAPMPGLGYLGAGVAVVAVLSVIIWRHDRRVLLFAALGVVATALSLGPGNGHWVPWSAIRHLPWVGNIVEIRFTLITTLCLAVVVAIGIDKSRGWLTTRQLPRPGARPPGPPHHRRQPRGRHHRGCLADPDRVRPLVQPSPGHPGGGPACLVPAGRVPSPGRTGGAVLPGPVQRAAVVPGLASRQPHELRPGRRRWTGRHCQPSREGRSRVRRAVRGVIAAGAASGSVDDKSLGDQTSPIHLAGDDGGGARSAGAAFL